MTDTEVYEILCDILTDDEIIWLSGGIWTFASRLGWPVAEIAPRLLEIILDAAGPSRTIIMSS
ncbi:MAG: hypothetical protein WCK65_15345, partial [Rhodospirillaceae bacterium]